MRASLALSTSDECKGTFIDGDDADANASPSLKEDDLRLIFASPSLKQVAVLHQGPRKPVHLRATNNFDTDESASTWKWLSRLHAFPDARAKSDARHDARRALARGMRRPVPLLRLLPAR